MIFYNKNSLNKKRISVFSELEANGQEIGGENPSTTEDYTAESSPENQEQTEQESEETTEDYTQESEPQEDNASEDQEPQDDGEETTDYTQGDEGDQDQPDNQQQDAPSGGTEGQDSAVDDFKRQEEELYNSLTPEQLDIKHKELKDQFLNMFDMTVNIIERIGEVSISEEKIKVLEYISSELASIKDMLSDYIANVYKTKSYIENSITYNRFLTTLNALNKVLEEISEKDD